MVHGVHLKGMHGDILARMRLAYPGVQCETHLNSSRPGELTPATGVHEYQLEWRGVLAMAGPWDESERAGAPDVNTPADERLTSERR